MPLSIAQLLKPTTEDQAVALVLDTLRSLGFRTTAWNDGDVQYSMVRAIAKPYSEGTQIAKTIVENVITNPKGDWLDLVAQWRFGLSRLPAVKTERNATLTNTNTSGGSINVTDGSYLSTDDGVRYLVDGNHSIGVGASEIVPIIAEIAGAAGNVVYTEALNVQTPAYPGIGAAFINEDLTTVGVDEEGDDRLWYRCGLRWAELTYSVGVFAYELWALTAAPSLRRARGISMYPDPYEVRVALDPGVSAEITDVENYIASRIPPNDYVTVAAASVVNHAITLAPRVSPGTTAIAIETAIQAMLDALPIGGTRVQGASAGRLLRESITGLLLCNATIGTKSVGLTAPAADIVLGETDIVQGVYTIDVETVF